MSKETFYFSHDYNARADRKLVNVIMKHGMSGIGIYWCLVEMLYEEGGYMPTEYDRISFELRINTDVIQSMINDFDLFKTDADKFWSDAVLERLQERCEKSEKARESINKRWEKHRNNTNVIRTNNKRNTIKERKEEKKTIYNVFYDSEILKSNNDPEYKNLIEAIFGKNNLSVPLNCVLKMESQLSYEQFTRIQIYKRKYSFSTIQLLEAMENWGNPKKYKTVYGTFQTFLKRHLKVESL